VGEREEKDERDGRTEVLQSRRKKLWHQTLRDSTRFFLWIKQKSRSKYLQSALVALTPVSGRPIGVPGRLRGPVSPMTASDDPVRPSETRKGKGREERELRGEDTERGKA
jgi:hypothetical protein